MQVIWVGVVGHDQEGSRSNPFRPSSFSGRSHGQRMFAINYLLYTFHYFAVPLSLTYRKRFAAQEPFGWVVQHTSLTMHSRSDCVCEKATMRGQRIMLQAPGANAEISCGYLSPFKTGNLHFRGCSWFLDTCPHSALRQGLGSNSRSCRRGSSGPVRLVRHSLWSFWHCDDISTRIARL